MQRILVVEDEKSLNSTLCSYLKAKGYDTVGALSAMEAYDIMYGDTFDLIVSDVMMPKIDGFEFAETVRKLNKDIPILFLTAREDFEAKQRGYLAGIDDYMTKPVNLEELKLHIMALLRRAKIQTDKKICIGSFSMDTEERTAMVGDEEIPLTQREFNLLFKLLSYPKKTFTRSQLMDEFWETDSDATPRAVDVYITKLREKLSNCDDFEIVTVRGLGYKAVKKKDGGNIEG